ncbi:S-Ena type endospore appendage [Peribacillus simplex]|uniref:S-Ena type endospore appendage n=1 Tax=Peribacillus TaxID=2675229 RepID=UPI00315D1BC6
MCNSNSCCPSGEIFKEEFCGNFAGPLAAEVVWSAPAGSYIAGTFQLFNANSSTGIVTAAGNAIPLIALSATPGNTDTQSVNNPTSFTITAAAGDSGTYCVTLYKRVLA